MLSIAFHLWFPPAYGDVPDAMLDRAARHSWAWLVFGPEILEHPETLSGPQAWTRLDKLATALRFRNPRIKIGLYVGGIGSVIQVDPAYPALTDAMLLHAPTGAPLIRDEGWVRKIPYLAHPGVRSTLLAAYAAFAAAHRLDGLLFDGYDAQFYADLVRLPAPGGFGMTAGCAEGAFGDPLVWAQCLQAYSSELRWSLGQAGVEVYINGIAPFTYDPMSALDRWRGAGGVNYLEWSSGAMVEHLHRAYAGPPAFDALVTTIRDATTKRRGVFCSAVPRLLSTTDPTVPYTISQELERFFLATYLLVQDVPATSYGYHPYDPYRGWDDAGRPYVHWSPDWDLDYGQPIGPPVPIVSVYGVPSSVWARHYSKCVILVNPAASYQQVQLSGRYRIWDAANGQLMDMAPAAPYFLVNVPPKTGWVWWRV